MDSFKALFGTLFLTFFVGCTATESPRDPSLVVQPEARPVHNVTSFSGALSCMDDLFADYGVKDIIITSQGIPDATGEIHTGTKEMLISTVSHMSTRSGAFRFVDYDQRQLDINALQQLVGFTQNFLVPNYYIRGAITQFDEQVLSEGVSGGISLQKLDVGAGGNITTSLVSIDMNMGDLLTRQILPGISANNTIAVSRTGRSSDMNGSIDSLDLGFSFNVNLNKSEGMHQSVRTLVQLSAIEILGKLTTVPYWQCLGAETTTKGMMEQARGWYQNMSVKERRVFVQRALAGKGLYQGEIDGEKDSAAFRQSVGAYQAGHNLLADGAVTFQLYLALLNSDISLKPDPEADSVPKVRPEVDMPSNDIEFSLASIAGNDAKYKAGDTFAVTLQASQDVFAYCYYEDSEKQVVRLFPNRYQPNALLSANAPLSIPGPTAQFEIVLEHSGFTEEVMCLASNQELGIVLPERLKGEDLVPLPVESLDAIASTFQSFEGAEVVDQRLTIEVGL